MHSTFHLLRMNVLVFLNFTERSVLNFSLSIIEWLMIAWKCLRTWIIPIILAIASPLRFFVEYLASDYGTYDAFSFCININCALVVIESGERRFICTHIVWVEKYTNTDIVYTVQCLYTYTYTYTHTVYIYTYGAIVTTSTCCVFWIYCILWNKPILFLHLWCCQRSFQGISVFDVKTISLRIWYAFDFLWGVACALLRPCSIDFIEF